MQDETAAALSRILPKAAFPSGIRLISAARSNVLKSGSSLSIHELLVICKMLENTALVRHGRTRDTPDDCLSGMFGALDPLTGDTAEIRRCIISEEEIRQCLFQSSQYRRNIKSTIRNGIIAAHAKDYLQDSLVTTPRRTLLHSGQAEYKGGCPGRP